MHAICEHNQWFEWHARCYHFVPVYRGFWLSGVNLAEVGHSMLKFQQGYTKISLVDASFKDITFQLRQDEKSTSLINNEEGHVGSGLNYNKLVEKHTKPKLQGHMLILMLLNMVMLIWKQKVYLKTLLYLNQRKWTNIIMYLVIQVVQENNKKNFCKQTSKETK